MREADFKVDLRLLERRKIFLKEPILFYFKRSGYSHAAQFETYFIGLRAFKSFPI